MYIGLLFVARNAGVCLYRFCMCVVICVQRLWLMLVMMYSGGSIRDDVVISRAGVSTMRIRSPRA